MNRIRPSLLACVAGVAIITAPASASVDEYSVDGQSVTSINLQVCSVESQLAVRGDTGTDLDFTVSNAGGDTVASDEGVDDYMSIVIEKEGDECETFKLDVSNLGEETNAFTVVLEPITENSMRVQKYIIAASDTQTIDFKACGTSANVSARGDGDTDLDYIIRNSDEGVVHEDAGETDETSATLTGLLSDCETFEMEVSNLGEVYNALMVVVTPQGADEAAFAGTPPSTSLASQSIVGGAGATRVANSEGAGSYRADGNETVTVMLPVCTATRMEVRGDGETDLDFTVRDSDGNSIHSDFDMSDVTFATLEPQQECETFAVAVSNLGENTNDFMVALTDLTDLGNVSGPGEYRVNGSSATKVALRVCEVTKVTAKGDGDSDLDFEVTDAAGSSIHSDYDMTDVTNFTLNPGDGCADFQMSVDNVGDVLNIFTVAFGDEAVSAGAVSATAAATTAMFFDLPEDTISTDGNNRYIAILNRTGETLDVIHWSNSATLDWGEDKLGDAGVLAQDQQWNVNVNDGSNACLFDFKGVTQSGREIEVQSINACDQSSVTLK